MCAVLGTAPSAPAAILITEKAPNGDVKVTFRETTAVNDNTYGTQVASDWPRAHSFGDLTGSDKARFVFKNGAGAVVMDFMADYISASSAFPSGYGSLGVTGGDGSIAIGSAANVASVVTTLQTNLNQSPAYYGYTVNSPVLPDPNWDVVIGYTVVVKAAAFGASGFGSVQVPFLHNSPPKVGSNTTTINACAAPATNTAEATGTGSLGTLYGSSSATVNVTP
jgi:hypothetical protein